MSLNARNKGTKGERELAKWLYDNLGLVDLPQRNLEQVRSGGGDLLVPPFLYECKRVETLALDAWWVQSVIAARKENLKPVVAFRQNKKNWEFLISADCIGLDKGYVRLTSRIFLQYAVKLYK